MKPVSPFVWLRIFAVATLCGLTAAAWHWMPRSELTPDAFAAWFAPHRYAWYGLPAVLLAFVTLGLVLVPVVLLVAATGIAFGPVLGPVYAMAGSLASASVGFAIGRWLGLWRVKQLGGARVLRVAHRLRRNGTLAVFFIRKIPAPFTLVNIVVGASPVRYRDFLVGTTLGMLALVIGLAGFGYQIVKALQEPSLSTFVAAAAFVGVPLTIAWFVNHAFKQARPAG